MKNSLTFHTRDKVDILVVTEQLAKMVSDVSNGLAFFYIPHTTASLIISEYDEQLHEDLSRVARNLLADFEPFKHRRKNNPNAAAHIFSALSGTALPVAIEFGKLDLGLYQNILLLEMDGPKERQIHCLIIHL
jgi:secondary thiamine-phosphate synthase enzyme